MGRGYEWVCDTCGNEVANWEWWEFYRDAEGQRKWYGHPGPMSREAKEMGVKGFTSERYCPECRIMREVIVKEYEKPVMGGRHWSSKEPAFEYEALCPKCGTELKQHLDKSDICPKCNKGTFHHTTTLHC